MTDRAYLSDVELEQVLDRDGDILDEVISEAQGDIVRAMAREIADLRMRAAADSPDWAEMRALRKQVREMEALTEAGSKAVDALEMIGEQARERIAALETGLPAAWRSLADEQRYELAHSCCRGCGSLDTSCQCWNDE